MWNKLRAYIAPALLAVALQGLPAAADESKIPEAFRGETAGSPIQIDYSDWSRILKATVFDAGMSDRSTAPAPKAATGTRTVQGNKSTVRNEGNRLIFPAFADYPENLKVVQEIRTELEAVPDEVPLGELTKNEQLAYWLNLYNITVIELLAQEYPTKNLKKLKEGKDSLWDKKVLKVSGIPLSLNDIHHILLEKWDSTIVMYGMFQGYVGGPSIQAEAFTGDNVHRQLIHAAKEFVNSNRGMKMSGTTLEISELYAENKALFPDWNEDLKKHLFSLSEDAYKPRIPDAKRIKAKTNDYYIADLFNGQRGGNTNSTNTNSAAMMSAQVSVNAGYSELRGPAEYSDMGIADFDLSAVSDFRTLSLEHMRFPDHVMEYVDKVRKRNAERKGTVDIEEVDDKKSEDQGKPN
ncbi:MAG: DUF547 domain-containing protein [Alphaproteobacteria bacterium]|nr:MAG: DUF547 domain-containing protein [Alphaproteobacteria bacterium]